MTDSTPKVALLGRPGPAREHLRKALADLGGDITIEGEPGELLPAQVAATGPSVVVVSLDAAMEDKLDDWDELFDSEGLNVIFDEAETTSQLDGWDLARWARHLAAKILGHDHTLPPVPEGASPVQGAVDWIPSPGGPVTPAAQMDAERLEDYAIEALDLAGSVPVADDPQSDGAASGVIAQDAPEWTNDVDAVEAEELELDDELAALIAQHDANAAQDAAVRFDGASSAGVDAATGVEEDDGGADFTVEYPELPSPSDSAELASDCPQERAADAGTEDSDGASPGIDADAIGADAVGSQEPADGSDALAATPIDQADAEAQRFSFGRKLELVLDDAGDDDATVEQPAATPASSAPGAMSFDQLAAAFQLEDDEADDDEAGSTPAEAVSRGVVVLLAGMGGPDALRQLLSALPQRIPVPVVVWQQLNAGTHDRLASQLAKTGKVETALAQVGESLKAGMVYILPPGIGLEGEGALKFSEDASSPAGLLQALEPLGDAAVVVALSGAEAAWLAGSAQWAAKGGRLLAQSPATCFEASACDSLVKQGVVDAPPADLAIRALGKWHEDI